LASSLAPIIYTPGEPAGIGIDLAIILATMGVAWRWQVIADGDLLMRRAVRIGLPLKLVEGVGSQPAAAGTLYLRHQPLQAAVHTGYPNPAHAPQLLAALDHAIAGCMAGEYAALVTGPLHKETINAAGIPFTGHTEYLAAKSGATQVIMLLATHELRVALATTHLPLAQVAAAITAPHLRSLLTQLDHQMRQYFGLTSPRICVLGLNPHAGEGGYLGSEEQQIISPLLQELRQQGLNLIGPLPADTAFTPPQMAQCDLYLAMYHDQGLPVLKHLGFGRAVNITLGLPFIRTSVDHGTALTLAGSGKIDSGSLHYAMEIALQMASHHPQPSHPQP
jgi:4-hydroxythreonine-4-phosphate dehydrogenase